MKLKERLKKELFKTVVLWFIGGFVYIIIELLFRGRTHISMFVLGGLCFISIGLVNEYILKWSMPLALQALIGGITVTIMEFICGLIVNVWLKLNVWSYTDMPFNFMGQICLLFSAGWVFLSVVAIFLDDYLRHELFGERWPKYTLFKFSKEK